jgi:type IV fimbrial biogenesis protein FimT
MSNPGVVKGFTLVELMLVLAVLAVMLVVATPLLRGLLQGNHLRAESGRLMAALNLARSEAIMRNEPVSLCPSAMAETGAVECSGTYEGGWLVYSNPDRDRVVDAGTDKVIRVFEGLAPGYRLTNRSGTRTAFELISYFPDGTSRSNRTFLLCPPQPSRAQSRSIVVSLVGRARLVRGRDRCPVA